MGGIKLSPNFAAILIGLTVYTGAFIAEIVRAGIQSVAKGQSGRPRALACRSRNACAWWCCPGVACHYPAADQPVSEPDQNSSLAIAVGYPDLWSTAFTTLNQSGRAIQVFLIAMGTYLMFSLLISFS